MSDGADMERVVCPDCGKPCINLHGYHSHWAQKHWAANTPMHGKGRPRPEPIVARLTSRQATELAQGARSYGG